MWAPRRRAGPRERKMAAEEKVSSKRLTFDDKHICNEEVGPRGLTYDETSVVYSLLWNQPSLYPSQLSYSQRHANPLVRKGGQAEVKTSGVGLPLFYTDSEGEGEEEEAGLVSSEIRQVSPCVVERMSSWRGRGGRVVHHISPPSESDVATRVRSVLGYEFPPVMSRMVEESVKRKWLSWKERGIVAGECQEEEKEEEQLYQQLVEDTLVFMASEVERRLQLVDSDISDSDSSSSATSSSDEDIPRTKGAAVKRRKRKRPWSRTLPPNKRVSRSQGHETVCVRELLVERDRTGSSSSEASTQREEEREGEDVMTPNNS